MKEKIEICESKPNLPTVPDKKELIGLQQLRFTSDLVDEGEFEEAKERVSKAVNRFEQSNSKQLLPARLKRDAVQGILDESRCQFDEAAVQYSNAAEKAEDATNARAYEVWSKIAEVKGQLTEGDIEEAKQIAENIDYNLNDIYLIDLKKLKLLFEVHSKYTQAKQSDPQRIFDEVNIDNRNSLPSSDSIIQFNTDYSAAFTMLITRQRQKQLNMDSDLSDDSYQIIRDAITPTGLGSIEPQKGETFTTTIDTISDSGNGVIVEYNDTPLNARMNIGSVVDDSVGERVKIKKVHSTFGWCLTNSVKDENYTSEFEQMLPHKKTSHLTSPPPTESDSNKKTCPQCNTVLEREDDLWSCSKCGYEHIIDKSNAEITEYHGSGRRNNSVDSTNSQNEKDNMSMDEGSRTDTVKDADRDYKEAKRVRRDPQFQEKIKEAYNQTCAVCGSDRRTPDGRPEVEAAHIRPVSEGGKDIIPNGIALCRLHHWAFDNDWISVDDDYSVIVKNASAVSGYEDFAQYQGSRLNLPELEENQPDKNALEFHRHHHGFENGG